MSKTMVETCVLTLGELIERKLQCEKMLDKEQHKTICEYFVCGEDKADKQYQLTIPDYQRAYVWSEDMVKIMLEDIDEQRKEGKKYLLSILIIYIDDSKEKNDDKIQ